MVMATGNLFTIVFGASPECLRQGPQVPAHNQDMHTGANPRNGLFTGSFVPVITFETNNGGEGSGRGGRESGEVN